MWNPVRRLKLILGELLANGQQARLDASRTVERLDAVEQRLEVIAADSRRLPGIEATLQHVERDVERLRGLEAGVAAMGTGLDALNAELGALRDKISGPPAIDPRRVYFGLDELDRALSAYLDIDYGYFVELGANDGVSQSNTLHFEKFRGWSGVLVEPTPHNFLKCRANRSSHTHIFCCACTAFDYAEKFVEVAYSNLMTTPIGLDSDISDPIAHAREGRRFLAPADTVFTFGARARPLNDLLIEAGSPATIDLLSLDVEGAEMEVLKGIDHDRFRFRYICVECRDIDRMTAYLKTNGYELVEKLSGHDFLFKDARMVQ
jgi:FkbM family methyltransferase